MSVNVAGLFTLTRELLPLLEVSGSLDDPARVINLGSVMGMIPIAGDAYSYSASKAAVHHLTRILAFEFANLTSPSTPSRRDPSTAADGVRGRHRRESRQDGERRAHASHRPA